MEKLEQVLEKYVAGVEDKEVKGKLLGAGIMVADKTGILYTSAAGRIGLDTASPAYTTDTVQWIASMTKLITSTAVLQLVERGVLSLDEDVRARLPELASMQILKGFDKDEKPILEDNTTPITLRNLLTHTAGTGYDVMTPSLMKWAAASGRDATQLNCLTWSAEGFWCPLLFTPGTSWVYGTALDWAGLAVERATGQRLGEYMREHIFAPLGMDSTSFWPEREIGGIDGRRAEWVAADAEGVLERKPQVMAVEHPMESGGAGLYSTAGDYAKLLAATVQPGRLLSRESFEAMIAPQLDDKQREGLVAFSTPLWEALIGDVPKSLKMDHGLGGLLWMEELPGRRKKGSMTWSGATNGHWWVDPVSGIAGAVTMQVQPFGLLLADHFFADFERAVYATFRSE